MTRNNFNALALVLKGNRRSARTEGEHVLLDRLVEDFADVLGESNLRFDRHQFVRAAGHGERSDAQGVLLSDLELTK